MASQMTIITSRRPLAFALRAAGVCVAAVLLAASAGTPAFAEPSNLPDAAEGQGLRDAANVPLADRARESINYLVQTYGVSEDEALRRLKLQARAPEIAEAARASDLRK